MTCTWCIGGPPCATCREEATALEREARNIAFALGIVAVRAASDQGRQSLVHYATHVKWENDEAAKRLVYQRERHKKALAHERKRFRCPFDDCDYESSRGWTLKHINAKHRPGRKR